MNDKSTEIAELKEKVRLLREILELKEKIAEFEEKGKFVPLPYPYCPYPNGTPWFPRTWSDSTSYQPNPGEVLVVEN